MLFPSIPQQEPDLNDLSISETTAELSPMKSGESYANKFDLYYPQSYLPHVTVTEKDELDDLVEKPSMHTKAFRKAKEMVVPSAPSQHLKGRHQSPQSLFANRSLPKPINLKYSFDQNADTPEQSVADPETPFDEEVSPTKAMTPQSPQEPKTIDSPDSESIIDGIRDYFSQLRLGSIDDEEQGSQNRYTELWSKMGSIAKSLTSHAPEVKQATSACETNICNFMEAAQELMTPSSLRATGYATGTPLDQSWLEVEHDSDSVSKLTTPFNETSMLSEATPIDTTPVEVAGNPSAVNTSATRIGNLNFEWK